MRGSRVSLALGVIGAFCLTEKPTNGQEVGRVMVLPARVEWLLFFACGVSFELCPFKSFHPSLDLMNWTL